MELLTMRNRTTKVACALGLVAALTGCPSAPPRNPPADVPTMRDQGVVDAGDRDVVVNDGVVEDRVPVQDAGIQVQITFVSAAINGQSDGGAITLNAQMSWHAAINGQSDGGAITIRGVMY